jgi:PEP-CTERM motif
LKGKRMFNKYVTLVACTGLVLIASISQAVELTTNGNFETGTFVGWTQFPTGSGQQSITSVNPASGLFAAEINNDAVASNSLIKQANIGIGVVTTGQLVTISFDARGSYAVPGGVAFAEFFSEKAGGGVSSSVILGGGPLAIDTNPAVWKHFVFTTTTGNDVSGGVTLQLGAVNGAGGAGTHMFFDNVSVSVVPEPATFAVLGLGAIALIRRKRKN